MTKKILLSLVTMSILLITFQNFSTSPQEIIIYISNNGNDLNSGQKQTPIKSLSRALQLVKERRLIQDSPARILFENGTYFGEKIIWNSYSAIYQTRFEPASNQFGGVIFDGRLNPNEKLGSTSYFINFNLPRTAITGQNTNIVISKLIFRYYFEVINFIGGNRNDPYFSMNSNMIEDSKFEKCGNRWSIQIVKNEPALAMATVRLVNSKNNYFINNSFEDIDNAKYIGMTPDPNSTSYGGGLHAFYIAHYSSNNTFEGNTFINHNSGSVIKIRDQSHYNRVLRNRFDMVTRPVQLWHCEPEELMIDRKRGLSLPSDLRETLIDESNNPVGCTKSPLNDKKENYECLSQDTLVMENLFQRDSKSKLFSELNDPIDIFENSSYACQPNSSEIKITESRNGFNQGYIISTLMSSKRYFGLCSTQSDCVNNVNTCFANYTGSEHLACVENKWKNCSSERIQLAKGNTSEISFTSQTGKKIACLNNSEGTDANWHTLPAGQHFVSSLFHNKWNYQACNSSLACVNSEGRCWSDNSGSKHFWCHSNKWEVCNKSRAGLKSQPSNNNSKTCTLVKSKGVEDYNWK